MLDVSTNTIAGIVHFVDEKDNGRSNRVASD